MRVVLSEDEFQEMVAVYVQRSFQGNQEIVSASMFSGFVEIELNVRVPGPDADREAGKPEVPPGQAKKQ